MLQRHRDLNVCSNLFLALEDEVNVISCNELGPEAGIQYAYVLVLLEIGERAFVHPSLQALRALRIHSGSGILDFENKPVAR